MVIAAPTNASAAAIIHGITVNKAFRLSCYGISRIDPSTAKGLTTLREEQERLSRVKLLIIDEMSLLGLRMLPCGCHRVPPSRVQGHKP